ncbi:porin family protein [Desulfoprunum benzoelyticum]|uniref:Opacity protein-like surface antigen n=1 Tax=Desulfoprunum benzoelyticum TaxID=1506996 RepID=A0A840US25_9BACT|nr:outer membrane protein [Desulfoprunum benzoelyticum]MBB5348455.1 opacity protein-like surface antigen [Desulfoprunum benzoelyticum]MBM9530209.1 porin family protein [Desulfoprunum benzoelyticum]
MKKVLCTSLVAATFIFTATAYSADGVYVSADVGMAFAEDADVGVEGEPINLSMEFDSGVAVTGAIGYRMGNVRMEAEIGYQNNDTDEIGYSIWSMPLSGDMTATSFLANGYYDFTTGSRFTPFITAGIGMAEVEMDDLDYPGSGEPSASDDDTAFAWQVGAGVSYAVNANFDLEVKYRYFVIDDVEILDGEVESPSSHNVYLGMRYTF